MSNARFEFGDQVRHPSRPEWGVGSVVRVEDVASSGTPAQRVSVRFPHAGLKVLNTGHVDLEAVQVEATVPEDGNAAEVADWDRVHQSGWLSSVAERKIDEAMITLAATARDPFRSVRDRLAHTLDLYRFDRETRLVEWAVAQSGLEDPLSRFTRHELEVYFDRWATEREEHLRRLLREPDVDRRLVDELVAKAPKAGGDAVRRVR